MTERINLAALRVQPAEGIVQTTDLGEGYTEGVIVPQGVLHALVDAVEAAVEAVAAGDFFPALPPEFEKLRETLARFDFPKPTA